MVNLLFISNNPKIYFIKNALQPSLKIKVDCVGDFDHGLRDVIEKRPAMVFIQDMVDGVTGESVVRHIQVFLGSSSPAFILMHDGNPKAKSIKGLYDYLIDLSQDNAKVLADVKSTIKVIHGPTREMLYDPFKANKSAAKVTLAVSEERRTIADKLLDDFISELEDVSSLPITPEHVLMDLVVPDVSSEDSFVTASSPHEQLAEIISEFEREHLITEAVTAAAFDVKAEKTFFPSGLTAPSVQNKPPTPLPENSKQDPSKEAVDSESPSSVRSIPVPAVHVAPTVQEDSTPIFPGMSERPQSPPISPAEFRIERERKVEDVAVKESMRAVEANYISKTAAGKWYLAVAMVLVLCLTGGGWYLVQQGPHQLQPIIKKSAPAIVPAPATQPVTPVPVQKKSTSVSHMPESAVLPSFIPLAGQDRTFASQKPGWERYVGADSEFRVFRSAGKLRAVQVLATKGHVISESRLKSILNELTGTGEYRITSHEQKLGFQVSRATVNRNADLLIYRKKSAVHALVVSLD